MPAVMLDANLLVLLIVGSADRSYIARHKRLRAYTEDDFDLLQDLIAPMSTVIVTPNILTEAANLASQIGEPARTEIAAKFQTLVDIVEEHYIESKCAVEQAEFPLSWLTDSGILHDMTGGSVLLTADLDLYLAALRRGLTAENFNYLRRL
jgi:hypothetical protein